jgi:hypothetical protein
MTKVLNGPEKHCKKVGIDFVRCKNTRCHISLSLKLAQAQFQLAKVTNKCKSFLNLKSQMQKKSVRLFVLDSGFGLAIGLA